MGTITSLGETTNEGKGRITPLRPVHPSHIGQPIRSERDFYRPSS